MKTGKGETVIEIKRGQFVYGRKSAARELEMAPSTIRNIITLLARSGNLIIKADSHYSIITILNYDTYQDINTYRRTGKRTGKGQPKDTNNNVNNDKKVYTQNSDEFRMAELLFSFIIKRHPDNKIPDFQEWAMHIDKMIRIDGRKPKEIERLIEWCQGDDFWQNTILSTAKLRKQFDALWLKAGLNGRERSEVVL